MTTRARATVNLPSHLDRRRFLAWASASAAWIAAHPGSALGSPGPASQPAERLAAGPRILSLELLSAAPISTMKEFYQGSLGLRVLDEQRDRLTLAAGLSSLTFVAAGPDAGEPFYHFAFNIPENKAVEALAWQKERSPLMPIPRHLQDDDHPELVHFRHWNAHSVFFYDPAGNVVEYIARHDLGNAAAGSFGSDDILYASEIGLIVDEVAATAAELKEVVGVEQYRGGDEQFTALGDERGLLLVMKRGRRLNFQPSDPAKAARVFRTAVRVHGLASTKYPLPGFPYELSVER